MGFDLVVYRANAFMLKGRKFRVEIDGVDVGKLKPGAPRMLWLLGMALALVGFVLLPLARNGVGFVFLAVAVLIAGWLQVGFLIDRRSLARIPMTAKRRRAPIARSGSAGSAADCAVGCRIECVGQSTLSRWPGAQGSF